MLFGPKNCRRILFNNLSSKRSYNANPLNETMIFCVANVIKLGFYLSRCGLPRKFASAPRYTDRSPYTPAASPLTIRRFVLLECPYIAFYYGGERHIVGSLSAACDVPVRYVLQTVSHQCVSNVDDVSRYVAACYDARRRGLVTAPTKPCEPHRT